jgi:hypothetical protein
MTVTGNRRKFRREGGTVRRDALIDTALHLVAEGGSQAATLRVMADRAGGTPGLTRPFLPNRKRTDRGGQYPVDAPDDRRKPGGTRNRNGPTSVVAILTLDLPFHLPEAP